MSLLLRLDSYVKAYESERRIYMESMKKIVLRVVGFFLILTVLCGGIYTFAITGVSQILFRDQANGSIIEIDGKKYGSSLLGQQYTDMDHMWGRIMNIDTATYTDDEGNPVMYAVPSNLSPASQTYEALIKERVEMILKAHPDKTGEAIPVDLVTCSGSGLDPHISLAAAKYQITRIANNSDYSEQQIQEIVDKYTTGRFLGIFGEPVVNVLQVNLALDGLLK